MNEYANCDADMVLTLISRLYAAVFSSTTDHQKKRRCTFLIQAQNDSHVIFYFLVKGFGMELHYFQTGLSFVGLTLKFSTENEDETSYDAQNKVSNKTLWSLTIYRGRTSWMALLPLTDAGGHQDQSFISGRLSQNDLLSELKGQKKGSIQSKRSSDTIL